MKISLCLLALLALAGCTNSASSTNSASLDIYLVRHGEALRNVPHPADATPLQLDTLTPHGVEQIRATAAALKGKSIAAIFASPAHRTVQTADLLAQILSLPNPQIDPAFAALREGLTSTGGSSNWEWRLAQWRIGNDARPFQGESLADGLERSLKRIQLLATQFPNQAIIIVTHGDICPALIGEARGTPLTLRPEKDEIEPGTYAHLVLKDGHLHIEPR